VLLMYDGALRFMAQARAGFALPEDNPRRIETIHTALLRAQAILSELRANLDMEAGGDIAANLDRLYDYHLRRLFECNLRKDEAPLIEVETLVRTLRDAWAEMLRSNENRVA
jgi:flagellar protein FliS